MTEDEIYSIFLEMMEERKKVRKFPWEPPRMEFAMRVADIAYDRGFGDGVESVRNGVLGEPQ
jgi:hypothetical protein